MYRAFDKRLPLILVLAVSLDSGLENLVKEAHFYDCEQDAVSTL